MRKVLVMLASLAFVQTTARALVFEIDYTYDGGFFSANPTARAALEKAAADLGGLIGPTLAEVPGDTVTGSATGAVPGVPSTATIDWKLTFTDPSDGVTAREVSTFSLGADMFRLYVGARLLSGSTLGVGGPVGSGYSLSQAAFLSDVPALYDDLQAKSNVGMRGDAGPLISGYAVTANGPGGTISRAFDLGAIAGRISFDLGANWSFDAYAEPVAGTSDFYSVALHEMMHAIGIGTSITWEDQIAGTSDWTGPRVGLLTGGGAGLIDASGSHIAGGTMSVNLATGLAQEAVMDPTLTIGTRKGLTQLDAAFLADLGYNVVPEPATVGLLTLGLGVWLAAAQRRRG